MECRAYPKKSNPCSSRGLCCVDFSRTRQLPPTVQRHACEINFFHLSLVFKIKPYQIIHVQQATYPWLYSVFFGCSSKGSDWIICYHFALLLAPSCHINPMQVSLLHLWSASFPLPGSSILTILCSPSPLPPPTRSRPNPLSLVSPTLPSNWAVTVTLTSSALPLPPCSCSPFSCQCHRL